MEIVVKLKPFLLAGILLAVLMISPVSAELTNLSQLYPDMAPYMVTWENAGSDWQPAVNNSGIIWVTYYDMVPPVDLSFILTMNNGDRVAGSIVSEDPWPWYSLVTLTLGSVSNSTGVNHLPFIGVVPRYTLTYGASPLGEVYLVLLDEGRTGGSPYAQNGILVDLVLDPNVQVNPPDVNPAIRLETTSTHMFKVWGYTLTPSQLKHSQTTEPSLFTTFGTVFEVIWIFFYGVIGFVISFIIPNFFLVFSVGEGLLALYVLRKRGSIPAAMGEFISINVGFFEICARIFSYIIDAIYSFWQAVMKWL